MAGGLVWEITVAPLAGAWIETFCVANRPAALSVAPLAGAWIETIVVAPIIDTTSVAPLAGAWIETMGIPVDDNLLPVSRPSRARGLKLIVAK